MVLSKKGIIGLEIFIEPKNLFHAREFRISFLGSPPEKKNIAISKRLSLYTLISLPVNLELLKDIQRVKKKTYMYRQI